MPYSHPSALYPTDEKITSDDPDLANQLLLSACDPTLNFQVTSLAKPNWPRSAPTIPCMFYKDQNEKV